jgi:sarcosine oxidase subunit gamma
VADHYLRQGVLDHLHLDARTVEDAGEAGVLLCERRFIGKVNLRGEPNKKFRTAVAGALGFEPPVKPNTTAAGGEHVALWLGPNEWLVVSAPGAEHETAAALREALAGQHVAVTDVSEGRTVIGLGGKNARDVLSKGCPLDIHPRVFKPGQCAQSTCAKANILLHHTADTLAWNIYVERSFADYLWTWLEDAATEYGLAVVRG